MRDRSVMAIDHTTFNELREAVGDDFIAELVETFLSEAPTLLAELRSTLAGGDAEGYRRAAHSLKSNANTFGAVDLAGLARDVELGGFPDSAKGTADADRLDALYTEAAARLQELSRG